MDRTTAKTVMTARDTACTEQGADGAGANNDCVNRANVRLLCDVNPFTKPTVNVSAELCTGTNAGTSEADSVARTRICTTADADSFQILDVALAVLMAVIQNTAA